jgi:protein phosphatase
MGTTVVCALLNGGSMAVGHVGDSRLYLFFDGVLSAQTMDDTWAATVLANSDIDPERIAEHPMRNVLTNVVGVREQTEIHLSEHALRDGEMLLLCSDGVHNVLDEHALSNLLTQEGSLEMVARSVVTTAIDRGSRDNVTAVVVRYLDTPHDSA